VLERLIQTVSLEILILAGAFVVLFALEFVAPLRRRRFGRFARILVNAPLSGGSFLVGTFIVTPVAFLAAALSADHGIGLLHLLPLPPLALVAIGFLLMDLTFYYWHRLNHVVPFLWRFHCVHHIDPDMDVTTSFRFHFGEIFLSTGFRAIQVFILGIDPVVYVIYELSLQICTLFHHSNIRLPIRFERCLNKIIVTPRMHGIHHSVVREETDSNYSVVFRWWDWLHRTLNLCVPQAEITIGVAACQQVSDNGLGRLVLFPFGKQPDYWKLADGKRPVRVRRSSGGLCGPDA
jgi:sterol desaturase/sphingolipid hydroxylase (fatty acid hydroxylase superfamily)